MKKYISCDKRGYTFSWRKIRAEKLIRNPLCEVCFEKATLVHHNDRDVKNNNPENHKSLCFKCHYAEHKNELNYGIKASTRRRA